MFRRYTIRAMLAFAGFLAALGAGRAGAADGDEREYPWCIQEDTIRCYYMTREQCKETVDYHGFCIPNPDYHESRPKRR